MHHSCYSKNEPKLELHVLKKFSHTELEKMKQRPKELTVLALLFFGNAAYLTFQTVHPLDRFLKEHDFIQWMILALVWSVIPLTLRASRGLWLAMLLALNFIALRGWETAPSLLVSLLAIPAVLLSSVAFSRTCRDALLHPRRRWWLTPGRKRTVLTARLRPVSGGEILIQTFDISPEGIFLTFNRSTYWKVPRSKTGASQEDCLEVGTYCWLRIPLTEVSALTCTAEIVRKTKGSGSYPPGIGLRFVGLSPQDKKLLSHFLKSQEPKASLCVPSLQTVK
jgi:hypothetical protein